MSKFVDLEYVKSTGLVPEHDLDAIEAVYPGTFEKAATEVSERFAGRAVPADQTDAVKRHVAAMVVAQLWPKRALQDEAIDSRLREANEAARAWLTGSTSIVEARASVKPPPGPLPGASGT